MEDFDIYADLPSFNINEQGNEVQENNNKQLEERNCILEKEVSLLKKKVEELQGLNDNLKNNFSSLMKTAKAEIARKDRTIKDLRTQLDDFKFRRNKKYQNNIHVKKHPYINYIPPPINAAFNNTVEQYQNTNDPGTNSANQSTSEEFVQEEKNIETPQNTYENEYHDEITNKSSYRSTIYGDRLIKKLQQEKENEKKKKAEELNQNIESLDKVNNKENLALINEVTKNADSNINSDKTFDAVTNTTDFVKSELTLKNKIDSLETKEDQSINIKNKITENNKCHNTTTSAIDSVSKSYSNNCNNLSIYKNHKNQNYFNRQDRYTTNEVFYTKQNNLYTRQDKHRHLSEKQYRHRSSHRYKSRDRERSSSSSGTKEDYRKRYCKSMNDKYDHTSEKVKSYRKNKEDKYNYEKEKEDKKMEQSIENRKKQKKDYIKSPKRKRRSTSEESICYKTKRSKTNTENSNNVIDLNGISIKEEIKDSYLPSKEKDRRKLKFDAKKSENYVEDTKESMHESCTKKIEIQKYNEKILNNVEYLENSGKSNTIEIKETKTYSFKQKDIIPKQKTDQNNFDEVISITSNTKSEKLDENVKCFIEELEEGEILDSPKHKLQNDYADNCKVKPTINANTCIKNTILKEFKIQENDEIKEKLSDCKIESNDLSKTSDKNNKLLEIKIKSEKNYTHSVNLKEDESKNVKSHSLITLLSPHTSEKPDNSSCPHKKLQENIVENLNLEVKSEKPETNCVKSNTVCTINTKIIKTDDNNLNNKIPELHIQVVKQHDNDDKLHINDNEIYKEKNIKTCCNEENVENTSDFEECKDSKLQIIEDEVKEIDQNSIHTVLQENKKNESKSNDNLDKLVIKDFNHSETENSLNKSVSKSQPPKNVIMIRHRRKPVQLSDSPPVLIISQTDVQQST